MSPGKIIITGGQTGVDTAAIKAAVELSIPFKGWVPRGFTNERGLIPADYRAHLQETPSAENAQRTEWNMRDADCVLTILRGQPDATMGGTKLGVDYSYRAEKEMCFVDLTEDRASEVEKVRIWLKQQGQGKSVAVGGPRESEELDIEQDAESFLLLAFDGI